MKALLPALAALSLPTIAWAQVAPGDPGAGTQRGIQQLNNSGQVGSVTLFRQGARTLVVVGLEGSPPGRRQSVRIYRAAACDAMTNKPVYFLADLASGHSSTMVQASEDKLLSGNYSLVVFSDNHAGARMSACGHLYA
ncbi:MAG: hypothetical protein JOZ24_06005 [Candidatus Eremiobacteraeota bacterium]|nr:hypothetical protein [Candidatus Eremiobacteraeota bacterium]